MPDVRSKLKGRLKEYAIAQQEQGLYFISIHPFFIVYREIYRVTSIGFVTMV